MYTVYLLHKFIYNRVNFFTLKRFPGFLVRLDDGGKWTWHFLFSSFTAISHWSFSCKIVLPFLFLRIRVSFSFLFVFSVAPSRVDWRLGLKVTASSIFWAQGHGRNSAGGIRMGRARGGIKAWNRGIKESDLRVGEKALCLRPKKC